MDTSWIENLLRAGSDAYSTVKTADALKHQQVNSDSSAYTNGAFQTTQGSAPTNTVLLIGAAVLLVMFLKD